MLGKVLIANRGEIALRVIRTCRSLGVKTAAIYSDADAGAPHVQAADEALRIGPSPVSESYLSIDRILAAARQSGADAIHPGYGFLSERPEFADACAAAGIVFIGPPLAAMRQLGDKVSARRLAETLDVPCAPGYHGEDQTPARLGQEAARIGLPLLIKAAAGGGGRGMRRVDRIEELPGALDAAAGEAIQAFGDGRVFLERLIEPARHVEVQILGDAHGKIVALGDRDCSLQRRHQKLVEEAPAPDLPDDVRRAMHEAAVRLARAAAYTNAGTVEFLVSGDRFFFLELNARLQVEHTVTEMVGGLDLVEWQLRIAAGEQLALPAAATIPRGHAIQARIYAEDPAAAFTPAAGVVRALRWPDGPGVRVDAAVTAAGQHVSSYYDPLLAKIICWGSSRLAAIARLDEALSNTLILGLPSTGGFLRRVLGTAVFRTGPVDTGFLAEHPELAAQPPLAADYFRLATAPAKASPWQRLVGWRMGQRAHEAALRDSAGAEPHPEAEAQSNATGASILALRGEDGREGLEIGLRGERRVIWFDTPAAPPVDPARIAQSEEGAGESGAVTEPSAAGNWFLAAPLPGRVTAAAPDEDVVVGAGTTVASIEAMKMQHALVTPRAARVVRWLVDPGTFVRSGQPVVELAPLDQQP